MDQKMFLALVLSMAVVFGYYALFPPPPPPAKITETVAPGQPGGGAGRTPAAERDPQAPTAEVGATPRQAPPQQGAATAKLIAVETPRYRAVFDTRGAKLVTLKLKEYRLYKETFDWADLIPPLRQFLPKPKQDQQALVEMVKNDLGNMLPLTMEFRGDRALTEEFDRMVFSADREQVVLPSRETAPTTITFSGRAANGLTLLKRITLHADSFVIDVKVDLINYGDRPRAVEMVTLFGEGPPKAGGENVRSHFGPVFSEKGSVDTENPDDIEGSLPIPNPDWVGITANYFLSAAAYQPQPSVRSDMAGTVSLSPESGLEQKLLVTPPGGQPKSYLVPLQRHRVTVADGDTVAAGDTLAETRLARAEFRSATIPNGAEDKEWVSFFGLELPKFELLPGKMYAYPTLFHWYLGPKKKSEMADFGRGLEGSLDLTLDFLASPLLSMLHWFYGFVGNYGIAIILLTFVVRVALFPLTYKGMVSMKRMQKVQPKVAAMREKFKNDKERQNKEMMEIYRRNKVNPLGGCLPIALQIPIFFALYGALLGAIELRHAPFMLWVVDLSAKDPLYITPLLMGGTMFLQQRLTPTTMDPTQQKIFMWMPLIFLVFMVNFPSGLVLYWLTSNSFSILQQLIINRIKIPEPVENPA